MTEMNSLYKTQVQMKQLQLLVGKEPVTYFGACSNEKQSDRTFCKRCATTS
jgi:hypothetical protein